MNTIQSGGIVLIDQPGPADVLKYHTITLQPPAGDEVLIHQKAIGVNYLDVFFRNGTFPMPAYPAPIGLEAAGVIEAVGTGVAGFAVGDRVAYHFSPGAYAERRLLKANDLFKLPDDISFEQAAAVMIKGLTAHMLVRQSHVIKPGEAILIHAMTGGVGTVVSNWARSLGASVIGTVGNTAKKELALRNGFDQVIDLQTEDFGDRVLAITEGKGVDVVYDSIGETTFNKSLALIKEGGTMVLYGWSSGMPVIDMELMERKKIRFERAKLNDHLADREGIKAAMAEIFNLVRKGVFGTQAPSAYALADASSAHYDLESRRTTGSIILQ